MNQQAISDNRRLTFEQDSRNALQVPVPIDVFQCQTTAGTAFTAVNDFRIELLVATNVTGTDSTVTVYFVPDGDSASAANEVVSQEVVPDRERLVIFNRENVGLLQPGMTLQVLCGTNDAVNIWGHGYDYQGIYG